MKTVTTDSHLLPFLSLFTSVGTLVCCALPALLVTIGAGAVLAGLVSTVPQLVMLSTYKVEVFVLAGVLIFITGLYQWRVRHAPCPANPRQAAACSRMRSINKFVFMLSLLLYSVGFFFAFIASRVFA
jgi:hypothetical protein